MRLISVNVNGIRAAARRGGLAWLALQAADVLSLQEVRASDDQLRGVLVDAGMDDWHVAHSPSTTAKGHAGVAILSRAPFTDIRTMEDESFAAQGRWLEVDVASPAGPVTVASAYVHTGEALTARQDEKYAFLALIEKRLQEWCGNNALAVVTGDLNIAHTEDDLRNWKGNLGKAGFLDDERALLDRWCTDHVVDVHRTLHGPGPGPYTWWSWRGKAFDNDAGWRIDYHLATRPLAARARSASVGRAPTYAERWSDHAPVTVDYNLGDLVGVPR